MKVAPLITVALILCIACPGLTQPKKKPKPKFCMGQNGSKYAVGDGYVDSEGEVCIRYRCVKKKKKVFMKENKCGIDGEWTNWSSWSACAATCGNATRTKERTCSILPPITIGNQCSGPDEKIEECSLPKCSHVHRSGQNSIDSIWLEIANIKDGIKTNKAAIAGHHGVLLHTDANYEYYKVPVPASFKMTSAVVLTTCSKLGMKPQCYRAYYADNACVQAPSNRPHGLHPYKMSKILCSTTPPQSCASTLNMFWYMNPDKGWYSGSACGATKAGGFCSAGKYYTSTSDMQYFAACLKPVNGPECNSYTAITDSWRKIDYNNGGSGTYACDDKLVKKWYRFEGEAGSKLPTERDPTGKITSGNQICGTSATSWMTSAHPQPKDEIVTRKVCFEYRNYGCYGGDVTIRVRACSNNDLSVYYVYELPPPPSCNYAYCALP